mmetsp:Transcript_40688/g.97589  ORF Transcript_40688/g.97589 Transcript_40688/m.97589 type:complete len:287 (+) Transcript_40688:725-1585(+)
MVVIASVKASFTLRRTEENWAVRLPSRVVCTDSRSLAATSTATFLAINSSLTVFKIGAKSSSVITLFPVMLCTEELIRLKRLVNRPSSAGAASSSSDSEAIDSTSAPSTSLPSSPRYVARVAASTSSGSTFLDRSNAAMLLLSTLPCPAQARASFFFFFPFSGSAAAGAAAFLGFPLAFASSFLRASAMESVLGSPSSSAASSSSPSTSVASVERELPLPWDRLVSATAGLVLRRVRCLSAFFIIAKNESVNSSRLVVTLPPSCETNSAFTMSRMDSKYVRARIPW